MIFNGASFGLDLIYNLVKTGAQNYFYFCADAKMLKFDTRH